MALTPKKQQKATLLLQKAMSAVNEQQFAKAEKLFVDVLDIVPGHPSTLNNVALCLLYQKKDLARAERYWVQAINREPNYLDAYENLLNFLIDHDRKMDALQLLRRATKAFPDNEKMQMGMARLLDQLGRYVEARETYESILAKKPNLEPALYHQAGVCLKLGLYDQAAKLYQLLLTKDGGNYVVKSTLAMCYLSMAKKDQAEALLREVIADQPDYAEAYRHLSMLKKLTIDDSDIGLFEQKLESLSEKDDAAMHLNFALGKAYDDSKQFEKAFQCYKKGNDLKRATMDFNYPQQCEMVEDMVRSFQDPSMFDVSLENAQDDILPIFIVGMPRSGTSLLEQIFSSVPGVAALGELTFIENIATREMEINKGFVYPDDIKSLSGERLKAMADDYIAQALSLIDGPKPKIIVDKLPFNFWHVGLIKLMFPNAKIIHSLRDPFDTCLSNFFQFFYGTLSYAYNLKEVGQYYHLHNKVMSHWKETLGIDIYTLTYDQLVQDPHNNMLPLFDYLGLPWDEQYLEFYRSDRPVRTMSISQVRQPIYKASSQRWRHYEPWIGELLDQFPDYEF